MARIIKPTKTKTSHSERQFNRHQQYTNFIREQRAMDRRERQQRIRDKMARK